MFKHLFHNYHICTVLFCMFVVILWFMYSTDMSLYFITDWTRSKYCITRHHYWAAQLCGAQKKKWNKDRDLLGLSLSASSLPQGYGCRCEWWCLWCRRCLLSPGKCTPTYTVCALWPGSRWKRCPVIYSVCTESQLTPGEDARI